ncbi:MAG: PAS domain S-box protein [Betaproteobacteria bacterium]|nr:PAS domain S-box protein [Betaproteobacteria bacterium]
MTSAVLHRRIADARRYWRAYAVWGFCALLVAGLWSAILVQSRLERARIIETADMANTNLARVLARQVHQTLRGVDRLLDQIATEYASSARKLDLGEFAVRTHSLQAPYYSLAVIGRHGDLLVADYPIRGAPNFRGRENFEHHRTNASTEAFVSKPRRTTSGPNAGKWAIIVSKRLDAADGGFAGYVSVAMDPFHFSRLFAEVDLGPNALQTLVGMDGVIRARLSGGTPSAGQDMGGNPIFRGQIALKSEGLFHAASPLDTERRLYGFRRVEDYGLAVVVGRTEATVLSAYWSRRILYYALGAAVSAVILFLGGLLARQLLRLEKSQRALRESEQRFSKAFYGSPIATAIRRLDDDVLLDCNPAFQVMLGLRREQVVGRKVSDINFYTHPDARRLILEKTQHREPIYGLEVEIRNEAGAISKLLMTVDYTRLDGADCGLASFVDITGRQRIEASLRESEERFAKAFHHNPVALAIRRLSDDVIIDWNPAFEKMFGYRRDQITGKTVGEIPVYVEPGQRAAVMDKARRGELLYGEEVAIRDAWGEASHVLMTVDYIVLGGENCALASFVDITERKRAETALREREELFARTFHSNPVAMGIRRLRDDVILDVNASFEKALGYRRVDLVGKTVGELDLYAAPDGRRQTFESSVSRNPIRDVDVEFRTRTGELIQVILTTDFLVLGGEDCALTSFLDITERKRAEMRVEKALREKEVLLKEVYHRVKNNLQVVASLLGMQSREVKDPEALRMFQESASRVKSMALVHEQLYRSGNLAEIAFSDYLAQLVEHLIDTHQPLSRGVPVRVRAGALRLGIETAVPCGLILNELISNAYKHGYDAGAKGKIELEAVRLDDGRVRLSVADDGRGLPEGFDARHTRSLGMRLVVTLTEQLEGELRYASDGGARFEMVFQPEDREARRLAG